MQITHVLANDVVFRGALAAVVVAVDRHRRLRDSLMVAPPGVATQHNDPRSPVDLEVRGLALLRAVA